MSDHETSESPAAEQASSPPDKKADVKVVRRCVIGHNQFAPGAVKAGISYALASHLEGRGDVQITNIY